MFTVRYHTHADLPDDLAYLLSEAFVDISHSASAVREDRKHQNHWILEWLMDDVPPRDDMVARLSLQAAAHEVALEITADHFTVEETPDLNWLEEAYKGFQPFSIGPFFIYGSHYEDDVPEGQIGLKVDAATAFGSGEHETTKGCMQAMLGLKGKGVCPWNILDMGTGSGILALAAWKLWKSPILAVDNDAESIVVTRRHAEMNGVALSGGALLTACGDGFHTPEVDTKKPYELILANILAGPVIEMAGDLVSVLDDNGYCVLSGMLIEQADLVASAYEGYDLKLKGRYDFETWTTLVLQK